MYKRRLFFLTSVVGTSTGLMMAFNALKVLYVARVVPLDIIGEFAVYMSVFGVLKLLSSGGLSGTLVHLHQLSKNLFEKTLLRAGLGACMVAVITISALLRLEPDWLSAEVMLTICLFPLLSISALFRVLLDRYESLINYNLGKIAGALLNLVVTVVLLGFNRSLSSLVLGLLSQELLISITIIYQGIREARKLDVTTVENRTLWKKGLNNLLSTGINYIGKEVDIYAFKLFYSIEILGAYFVLKSLLSKPMTVISSVLTTIGAHRLRKYKNIKNRIVKLYGGYLALILMIYLILFVAFHFFQDFIYNGRYTFGIVLTFLVFMSNFLRSTMVPFGAIILATGDFVRGMFWNLGVSTVLILITVLVCSNYALELALLARSSVFLFMFLVGIKAVIVPSMKVLHSDE